MANVPVPEDSIIAGLFLLITGAFGWLIRLERRRGGMTSEQREDLKDDLNEIKGVLKAQNEYTQHHREWVGNEIGNLKLNIAVVQSKMGVATIPTAPMAQNGKS